MSDATYPTELPKVFVQVADDMGRSEANVIHAISPDTTPQVAAMTYLITGADGHSPFSYFGQVSAPALWLNRNATNRFEPAGLETLERIARDEVQTAAFFRTTQAYEIALIAERANPEGAITAPMTRPRAGMRWRPATVQEVNAFVRLAESGFSIGHIAGIAQRVDIRITEELIRHHILSAGTTGSGKSNTNANIVCAAQDAGFATLIYDNKPDFTELDQPNDEPLAPPVRAAGLTHVQFWALGTAPRSNERALSVRACDLDPGKLAAAVFYRPGEELQSEAAEQLLMGYADNEGDQPWTIASFIDWLLRQPNSAAAANQMPFPTSFNERTFNAVRQKFPRRGRVPSWIDAGARRAARPFGGAFSDDDDGDRVDTSWLARMAPREVHVIRVDTNTGGRSYALFLDFAMREVARLRREQIIPPVMHLVDEAADLFVSPNRRLRDMMTGTLDEQVRKGRSLSIGFVISAQSAGDVPEQIRHNMNSTIAFKHKQPSVLREVLPESSDAIFRSSALLQPGEAIVQLFKTHGLLRCRMHQSPARLFKPSTQTTPPTTRSRGSR
jgi:hypothetical protein